MMEVKLAQSDFELENISSTLLQLRPDFDKARLVAQIKTQQQSGYQVAYIELNEKVLCVAGFVVGTKLAWGKHLYIDDLVTAEDSRSLGAGARMIEWLTATAKENGCTQIHLDSGVQRFAAHKFYLREGFKIASHHFSMGVVGE